MSKSKGIIVLTETAKSLYDRLTAERAPYVTRAEDCAKYTIPSIFPRSGSNSSTTFDTPYQSVGAQGVNNLAAKLLLALFPPNDTFFRLEPGEEAEKQLATQPELKEQVEARLVELENKALKYAESHQYRATISEALKVLIVTGNALLFLPPKEGGMTVYKLNSYVVQRDKLGNVIQIVTLDNLAYATVPQDVRAIIDKDGRERKPEEIVSVYTHVYLDGDVYRSYQETNGEHINGSDQQYPKDKSPWIPLRMVKVDGESYGRSFVEEYLGDIKSLEALQKAIDQAAAIAANILYLVNPNGITRVFKLSKAKAGDFVAGRVEDVQPLQLNKYADLQVVNATIDKIETRLSYIFLLNSAVQRNGERVTAEEIRYVAEELEDTLGGIYSILSQELQLPLVRRLLVQLEAIGEYPDMPDGLVEPTITTGLAAIGRGHDLQKLQIFLQMAASNPAQSNVINWTVATKQEAIALGLDTTNLVKSDEQLQQEQQMSQMNEMATRAAPQLAQGMMQQGEPPQQ